MIRRFSAVAVILGGVIACAPITTTAGTGNAPPTDATRQPVTETAPATDSALGTITNPGTCEGWATATAADATGGEATPLAAARKSSNGRATDAWALLISTDDRATFTSQRGATASRVTVLRLLDGTWRATDGQSCTRATGKPTVAAVIEKVTLACASRGIGFVVNARVQWAPRKEVSAWLYDDNDQAIGSQMLTSTDTAIGGMALVPVRVRIRTHDGRVIAEHAIDALPKHSYCFDHPDEPTDSPSTPTPAR